MNRCRMAAMWLFIGQVARGYAILSGKSAISRSKFIWSYEIKSTQASP